MSSEYVETSLGPWAVHEGSEWVLDLTALPLLHGLSGLARALAEMLLEQVRDESVEIALERRLRPGENPELLGELGVRLVRLGAERDLAARLAAGPEHLEECLRCLLGTLQRQRYREALIPPGPDTAASALLFEFSGPAGDRPTRWLLECPEAPRGGRYLRITLEEATGRRLDLAALPHLAVEDLEQRSFLSGATRIAHGWREGIRRAAEAGRSAYSEPRKPYSQLFRQFDAAGLGHLEQVQITWRDAFLSRVFESKPAELDHLLKKVLLALEDRAVRELLGAREVLRVISGEDAVVLELTHLGRVLDLGLGHRPERAELGHYLQRMPALGAVVANGEAPFAGVEIFLIHHMTAEILGLVAALRRLGCERLTTLFVTYAGETPAEYLRPLLDLPTEEFRALALRNVHDGRTVEGRYALSRHYSELENREELECALDQPGLHYLEAMRAVARIEYARLLERARAAGRKVLLIEDGGYLAPLLNREALASGAPPEELLVGTVEHTRNGHERLAALEREHGRLAYPALSIALSEHKRGVEAREVAASILAAVEAVLHASGLVLSRRNTLVLGSEGAIGRNLCSALRARLLDPDASLSEVDLVGATPTYRELPAERRHALDLILGVTGASVLQGKDLEEWLLAGTRPHLILASGSTKTVEFADAMAWLDALLAADHPTVCGHPLRLTLRELNDPQTGKFFGHAYRFELEGRPPRELLCLANLTPVNFLFYGVPTEVIDEVLAELLTAALDLLARAPSISPRLHVV